MTDGITKARAIVRNEHLTEVTPANTLAHLGVIAATYAAVCVVAAQLDNWLVWGLSWFVLAGLLMGNGAILHEAAHNHLFKQNRSNRIVANVVGALILVPAGTYRAYHLEHHVKTTGPDDPEGEPYKFNSRVQFAALMPFGGLSFIAVILTHTARVLAGRGPAWVRTTTQRREVAISALVIAIEILALAFALQRSPATVLQVWLIPYAISLAVMFPLVLLPEHHGGTPTADPLDNTRSVRSNAIVQFIYWNANFHAEHHAIPSVTYRGLPRLAELITPIQSPAWRSNSYVQFHWAHLRSLPLLPRRKTSRA